MTLEGKAHEFMEDHKSHCSCIHEIYRYRMDDLPRDEPQTLYRGLENHAPREVFDTFLLGDIIDSYFGDDEVDCDPFQNEDSKQFLEKAFKKRDSIYAKADKQWLRYLMKQCREHGLLDEEDEAA